jgi:glycosyltransferase involved in cell wall biosynthesis
MLSMARDPDMRSRYSRNARKRFEEYFQIEKMHNMYAAIYQKLLNGREDAPSL